MQIFERMRYCLAVALIKSIIDYQCFSFVELPTRIIALFKRS